MKYIAAAALTVALSAPAFAAGPVELTPDPVVAAPAPVMMDTAGDWTGFYAGGQIGYGDVNGPGSLLDGDGVLGGLHAGYRYDFGRAVVGAEIDYDFASIDLGDDNSDISGELEAVARIKLNAGYDLGRALVYGTVGGAYAEASVAGDDLDGNGYFYGIGADYAVTDRIVVGGEILRHEFDDFDDTSVDLDATTVRAKVSLRF